MSFLAQPSVVNYVSIPVAHAQEIKVSLTDTIKDKIKIESEKLGVNVGTSTDIAFAESSFKPDAVGVNGDDSGLYQFDNVLFQEKCIDKYHFATSLSQKNDVDIQIKCAIKLMADGQYWRWASSRDKWDSNYLGNSCVMYVKSKGVKLPKLGNAGNLDVNSSVPIKGGVVIMAYKTHHLAYIESVGEDGIHISEGNFNKGQITERVISRNDSHILGYYTDKE